MAVQFIFSSLEKPIDNSTITRNLLRASVKLALAAGTVALISFAYDKYLPTNHLWEPMSSCAVGAYQTSIVVAAYIAYSMDNKSPDAFYGRLNGKVSLIETGSALIGFFGTAAMRSNFLKLDQETSDHFFYSLLGLGVMGLVLKLIHFYQNNQLLRNCSDEV